MRTPALCLSAAVVTACSAATIGTAPSVANGNVVPGIEVLVTDSLHLIQGKRVGLLTNHTGRDRQGTSSIDLLYRAPGVKLTALFGPEHGIRGDAQAGEKVANAVDKATGVRVYSLYGDVRVPTAEMFKEIDVLLYDIQDVGARVYTYQWAAATNARAAKAAGKEFYVLDRPDPIRADRVEGNILDPRFSSGVGMFPVSLRYGMTVGELLGFLVGTRIVDANPRVIPMKNYRRSMWYDETGLPWINPSPNIRSLAAATLYPGTVFFEGGSFTEGRGTDAPFTQFGAAWLTDHVPLAAELNAMQMPGVRFEAVTRTVEATGGFKFSGETIPMVKVHLTNRDSLRSVELGIRLVRAVYARHNTDVQWRPIIDKLGGTDKLKAAVENNTVEALIAEWNADAVRFKEMTRPYWLYP